MILVAVLVCAAALYAGWRFATSPVSFPADSEDTLDVYSDPVQIDATGTPLPVMEFGSKRVYMAAIASYRISGILISKHSYGNGFMSDVSPWDYAIAWGEVPSYADRIKFRQMARYCLFTYDTALPVDVNYIQSHMSNNHMIPANANIRRALKLGKTGRPVFVEGYLVNVEAGTAKKANFWNTSTVRDDRGDGACEIIYVTRLRLDNMIYE